MMLTWLREPLRGEVTGWEAHAYPGRLGKALRVFALPEESTPLRAARQRQRALQPLSLRSALAKATCSSAAVAILPSIQSARRPSNIRR